MNLAHLLDKKRKEKERQMKAAAIKRTVNGATVGLIAGLAGGLLFAPKSGKESREELANSVKEVAKTTSGKLVETKNTIHEAKDKITKYIEDRRTLNKETLSSSFPEEIPSTQSNTSIEAISENKRE